MPTAAAPRGQIVELLLQNESTYGTAATGNYLKTPIYEDQLAELAPLEDDPVLGSPRENFRDMTQPAPGLKQGVAGSLVVPLDLSHSWFWFTGAFGTPAESGGAGDFVHTWNSGEEALPHRTIESKRKSDVFLQRTGCLVASLSGSLSRRGGYDRMTVGILGRKETNLSATGGGTPPTILARDPLLAVLPVLKITAAEVADIVSLDWTYNNGATPQDYLGDPEGYPMGHDLDAMATFTGTFRARFRTDTLYDLARAGTSVAMELLWEQSGTRSLSLAAPVVRLDPVGIPVAGPGRFEMAFNFRAEQDDNDEMLTVVLENGKTASDYA
jgi:hypothetical protein